MRQLSKHHLLRNRCGATRLGRWCGLGTELWHWEGEDLRVDIICKELSISEEQAPRPISVADIIRRFAQRNT